MKIEPDATWARPLAAVTALLLLLGAVGVLAVDGDGGTRLTAAAATTVEQKTARIGLSASFGSGPGSTQMSGEGLIDMARERSRMTLTSPFLSAPLNLVIDGRTAYVDSSLAQFQAMARGKPWVAFDSSSAAPGVGGDPLGGGGNPLQSLRVLREKGIVGSVRENGSEVVRGVRTKRHVGKLDVDKLFKAANSQQGQALASMARDAEGKAELWLDDKGVVRRSELRISFQAGAQTFTSSVRIEFFDFGVASDITPPPADQVHRLDARTP